jgi:hypothetical protein
LGSWREDGFFIARLDEVFFLRVWLGRVLDRDVLVILVLAFRREGLFMFMNPQALDYECQVWRHDRV